MANNNELTTALDSIPDGEDTLIVSQLTELFITRSYDYYERMENCREGRGMDTPILERRHKMPRKHYEDMARFIWGAAKQSNIQGAHTPETLLAIICGRETEKFFKNKAPSHIKLSFHVDTKRVLT